MVGRDPKSAQLKATAAGAAAGAIAGMLYVLCCILPPDARQSERGSTTEGSHLEDASPPAVTPVTGPLLDASQVIGRTVPEIRQALGIPLEIDNETGAPTDVLAFGTVAGRIQIQLDFIQSSYASEGSFIDSEEHASVQDMLRLVSLDRIPMRAVPNPYANDLYHKGVFEATFPRVGLRVIEVGGADPRTCNWVNFGNPE